MWLASDTRQIRLPAAEVLAELQMLGDQIAGRLASLEDPRACDAREDWRSRGTRAVTSMLEIATSLPAADLDRISGGEPVRWFEVGETFKANELMAAARMTGPVTSRAVLEKVVGLVKECPHGPTRALDDLSRKWHALAAATGPDAASPADEGYRLAEWLRGELALAADDRLEPETWLQVWSVKCRRVTLETDAVDAVAVWGPQHGPAVIINESGRHARSEAGRRATLAHEVVHLVADREGALPLADVVGGNVARAVEQRARAGAAELLIPRATAGNAFASGDDPAQTLQQLCAHHGASEELVAWQVRNSDISVPEATWALLRSKVSAAHRF